MLGIEVGIRRKRESSQWVEGCVGRSFEERTGENRYSMPCWVAVEASQVFGVMVAGDGR